MEYQPDNWVVLKITQPDQSVIYKVLAGWSGGYLDGDSWRMNSGITAVEKQGPLWGFYGRSGSVYWCRDSSYRISMATGPLYSKLKDTFGDMVELMPKDTNWTQLNYEQ
jgi:hypothetical protein